METAGQKTGEAALTALGTRMRGTVEDQLNDVPHLTRALDLLFHAPAGKTETAAERETDTWLPDLQVRLVRRGAWTLVCKGGNNGENHNHNDVGSFILSLHGEPAVVDAGNMVYTAKTFSGERYTLWNVQSAWHNLPEFGGCGQRAGGEYAARNVACLPDGMQLDMERAYDEEAGLLSLRRHFTLSTDGLVLSDEGILRSPREASWIFLLRERPEWSGRQITAGSLVIRCPEGLAFSAEEKPVTDPRMARNWHGSLWRVKLTAGCAESFQMRFVISAKDREA